MINSAYHHDDRLPSPVHPRIANHGARFLKVSIISIRSQSPCSTSSRSDSPLRMNTSFGTSTPPSPPQPALTSALTPAFLTASMMVSGVRFGSSLRSIRVETERGSRTGHGCCVLYHDRAETTISSMGSITRGIGWSRQDEIDLPDINWRLACFQECDKLRSGLEVTLCFEKVEAGYLCRSAWSSHFSALSS